MFLSVRGKIRFSHTFNDEQRVYMCVPCECPKNNGTLRPIVSSGTETHANAYRFDVLTLNVHDAVTNLAHHVSRAAPGPANTGGIVKCPALRLAAVFHATNAALRPSPVDIDAQGPVVKRVPRGIATNVQINSMLEWTFSR